MRPPLPGSRRATMSSPNSPCRFQAGASQHKHGRLAGLNDAAFQQSCERGGGDGGGRLHIEADPAQFEQSFFDLNFRNCDGRATGTPQGGQDFAGPHRLRDRRAIRDCRTDLNRHKIAGPGLEACVKRRAILRLRSEQPGPTSRISPRHRSSLKPMSQPRMLLPAPVGMMRLSGSLNPRSSQSS